MAAASRIALCVRFGAVVDGLEIASVGAIRPVVEAVEGQFRNPNPAVPVHRYTSWFPQLPGRESFRAELRDEPPSRVELLDTTVASVRDPKVSSCVRSDAARRAEQSAARTSWTTHTREHPRFGESLHAVAALFPDPHEAIRVDRDAFRCFQLPIFAAERAERRDVFAFHVKALDAVVAGVRHPQHFFFRVEGEIGRA